MATVTLSSSTWSAGNIRVTYTASNGTLKITEIEGKRSSTRSWNENDKAISVSVGGTSKSISLSHYVDFGTSWTAWGATDTSWSGLTGDSISISTTMQSGSPAYSGNTFSGNATMSWSTYTISYNANGGSGAPSSQTKTHGTNLTISSTIPTRTGYTFVGWALTQADANSGTWYYKASSTCGKNENLTLYAVWTPITYDVTINCNGGSGVSSRTYTIETASFTLGTPTRTGYTFIGWTGSNGSTAQTSVSITKGSTGNKSYTANWSEHKLTVNYYSNYATYATLEGVSKSVSASSNVLVVSQDFYYDDAASNGLADVQNPNYLYMERVGYTPTGYWGTYTNGGTTVNQSTAYSTGQALAQALGKNLANGNAHVDVYPQWKGNAYAIKYDSNGGHGDMNDQYVDWQEVFVIHDNKFEREGYRFIGWNLKRHSDNKWYVPVQEWLTEDEIANNGYKKKLYSNQELLTFNNSWTNGDEHSISEYTFYAVWEISGVVYIDNGVAFEPYLAYIDNGTDWELYIMYVDDGTNWNIIS